MEFTKNGIELCGKKYKFKKCTNEQILEHQKSIEAQQDKYKALFEKGSNINKDVEMIDGEIKAIGDIIYAIQHKQDPSDEELSMMIKQSERQIELMGQRRKLIDKAEELDKKHSKEMDEVQQYIVEQYGELASLQLEGMTKEIFVKECTSADMTIVRLLGSIRKMLQLGASTRDVEKFVKQNILAEANQSFQRD